MRILFEHLKKYPKMTITDAVKLLYQREFGGGHLITDNDSCIEYLKKEFAQAKECDELIEDLGNAMCRVYLGAVKKENIDIIKVGEAFIDSANEIKGDVSRFEQSLVDLLMECKKGNLPFSINELSIYIMQYKEKGYPPVSHSEVYRENYAPSYRVMHKKYAENLFCEENNK